MDHLRFLEDAAKQGRKIGEKLVKGKSKSDVTFVSGSIHRSTRNKRRAGVEEGRYLWNHFLPPPENL